MQVEKFFLRRTCCRRKGWDFLSPRPARGATRSSGRAFQQQRDFNPRAPCGARPGQLHNQGYTKAISIHAPLAGRDAEGRCHDDGAAISIHAPLAGCDTCRPEFSVSCERFQSTHPLRGATCSRLYFFTFVLFQSTHPLRGATVKSCCTQSITRSFQSTRPLRGATKRATTAKKKVVKFQSTRPLRGATVFAELERNMTSISIHAPLAGRDGTPTEDDDATTKISIHAPLAGRDLHARGPRPDLQNFNPRAPCGARRLSNTAKYPSMIFQSTRPLRGATRMQAWPRTAEGDFNPRAPCGARLTGTCDWYWPVAISIHAPLAGRDATRATPCIMRWLFQSTHPLRGATARRPKMTMRPQKFQSTHPLRGATSAPYPETGGTIISIHAPLAGCDDDRAVHGPPARDFNPRTPCGVRLHRPRRSCHHR